MYGNTKGEKGLNYVHGVLYDLPTAKQAESSSSTLILPTFLIQLRKKLTKRQQPENHRCKKADTFKFPLLAPNDKQTVTMNYSPSLITVTVTVSMN